MLHQMSFFYNSPGKSEILKINKYINKMQRQTIMRYVYIHDLNVTTNITIRNNVDFQKIIYIAQHIGRTCSSYQYSPCLILDNIFGFSSDTEKRICVSVIKSRSQYISQPAALEKRSAQSNIVEGGVSEGALRYSVKSA